MDARIIAGLRRRGVEVTTAADERLLAASDEQHLARASALTRVVVTADRDFLRLVRDQAAAGSHPGVLFLLPQTTVGSAVRALVFAAEVLDPQDMEGRVEWIPG